MKTKQNSITAAWDFVLAYVAALVALTSTPENVTPDWHMLSRALQSLPLATDDFALLSNRLTAARAYLCQGECGAAKYELNQLGSRLERIRELHGW